MSKSKLNKVVINSCYGGFSLSSKAMEMLNDLKGNIIDPEDYSLSECNIPRHDKDLVYTVEVLGYDADGVDANLKVVEFMDDRYFIYNEDGYEYLITPSDMIRIEND